MILILMNPESRSCYNTLLHSTSAVPVVAAIWILQNMKPSSSQTRLSNQGVILKLYFSGKDANHKWAVKLVLDFKGEFVRH